jgi:hypothetical protein
MPHRSSGCFPDRLVNVFSAMKPATTQTLHAKDSHSGPSLLSLVPALPPSASYGLGEGSHSHPEGLTTKDGSAATPPCPPVARGGTGGEEGPHFHPLAPCRISRFADSPAGWERATANGLRRTGYGVGDGLGATDALAAALPKGEAFEDALADPLAEVLPEALGPAEKLGSGLGLGEGNKVVGTFANESAKIRMKITNTITTHGLASTSDRGGSAPR